jgi:short subunit dehydrogenase-like uncharacterized protein
VAENLTGLKPGGILVADALNPEQVDGLARRTRIVLTTAGPFTLYAEHLVEACVRHRTHYLDITGETPWVRSLIDRFHEQARADGTRVIPLSGFDSVPADLGTWLAVQELQKRTGQACARVRASFSGRGGLNGGTMATALLMAETGRSRSLADPILLNPENARSSELRALSRDIRTPSWDEDRKCWLAPFVMAPINGHVVRRSHALHQEVGRGYGERFAYDEGLECRGVLGSLSALGITMGTGMLVGALEFGLGRAMVRGLAPSPGQGPSEKTIEGGFVRYRFLAEGEGGAKIMLTLSADGDPGNKVTVTILCESALAIATAEADLPQDFPGGLLTPATALGPVLLERLQNVDYTFDVEEI